MREKETVDPTFLRKSNYSYVDYDDNEISSVICFALSKNKNDLILHQQRIEYYALKQQSNLLFSALIDLFTALADKGNEYKQRMLDSYENLLTNSQVSLLTQAIITVLLPTKHINRVNQSLLNLGNQGELLSIQHIQKAQ